MTAPAAYGSRVALSLAAGGNCGTGAGGFASGNTCASGGGSGSDPRMAAAHAFAADVNGRIAAARTEAVAAAKQYARDVNAKFAELRAGKPNEPPDGADADAWDRELEAHADAAVAHGFAGLPPAMAEHADTSMGDAAGLMGGERESGASLRDMVDAYRQAAAEAAPGQAFAAVPPEHREFIGRHEGRIAAAVERAGKVNPAKVFARDDYGRKYRPEPTSFSMTAAAPSRIALMLSAGGDCDWKTIAGTHVCIGGDGKITKGPAALVGRTPGGGEVGPAKSGGGRGRYVVRGGHHVFEHETYAGPETAGNRLRPGDKSEMAGDWGDAKKGDKVEVVTTTQEGGYDRAVVKTADGREHTVQPSMVKPVRAHGDELQAAPGTRAPAEVVAAEAKHGAAPAFKPLAAHDYRDGGFSDFPAEHEGLSRLAYADPDKAASLVADGKAEEVGNSETDKYSGGKMIRLSEGVDPEEAGAPALPHDQQGMQAVHETLDAPKVQIPIRPGGKQIVAKQVNGEVYSTYDQKTGEYGLTTAGELDAVRERFAGEHPDVIAKLAEARTKKGLSASAAAPSRVALMLSATVETADDDWGDATDEEADGYDPEVCELPAGVVAELSAARPTSRILLSLNCGTGAGGFQPGNQCGKGRYGRSEGVRTSRTTLGNIRKAGAVKTKEFTDTAGRKVEEHTTPDGRTFHAVTHASGRRSFHQIDGPAKAKPAAGGKELRPGEASGDVLFGHDQHPQTGEEMFGPPPAGMGREEWAKAVNDRIHQIAAHNAKFRTSTDTAEAMRQAKSELRAAAESKAKTPAPAAAFARYRTPEGHDVRVGASGRIVAGDAKAVGLMGKRPEDVGAVPEAEYHAKQAAAKSGGHAAQIEQAKQDWAAGRAYVDNAGNYRMRGSIRSTKPGQIVPTGEARTGSQIAPWNKAAKAEFKDSGELHAAAMADKGQTPSGKPLGPGDKGFQVTPEQQRAAMASASRTPSREAAAKAGARFGGKTPDKPSPAAAGEAYRNAVAAAGARDAARKAAAGTMGGMSKPAKSPAEMPAAQINAELDSLDKRASALGDKLIAAGRGNELPSITRQKSDPLAEEHKAIHDRADALRSEIERRYGKRISRLPTGRGFGPIRKFSAAAPASRVALALACAPAAGTVVLSLSAADQAARPPAVIEPPSGMPASIDGVPVTYGRRRIATARPFVHILTGQSLAIDRPRIAMWLSAFEKRKARGLYPFIYPRHLEKDEQPDARQTLGYVVGMDADGDDLYATEQYIGPDAARTAAANGRSVTIMADALDDAGDKYPEIMHHLAATPMPALPQTNHLPVLAASGAVVMAPVYVCGPGGCRCSASRAQLAAAS